MKLIKTLTEGIENHYQIYCDLDGVLGDFDGRFEHFTGMFPDEWMIIATQKFGEKIARQRFWELIDSTVGVRYWRGIPFTEDGEILWNYIKQYNPIILTAPSRNEVSIIGKKLWVQDHLGPNIPIEFRSAQTKSEFARHGNILIDDRADIIQDWKSKNGIGLLYINNPEEIIRELNKLGI